MTPPLLKEPPIYPLPDPSENALWYGEVWLKYPLSRSLVPSNFGQMYKAKSQFRVIMNEFCQMAFIQGQESMVTIDLANKFLYKLINWFNGLPKSLLPRTIALPGQLQLQ